MKIALVQLTSSDDPLANLPITCNWIDRAAEMGASLVLTPEVTNCVSASRSWQHKVLQTEERDPTLAALRVRACRHGIWLLIGSLALKSDCPEGRFVNCSFLIGPDGEIHARYDKIHMFDVAVSETETYRESAGYRPGDTAVVADASFAKIGMTICYDVRFPELYRHLAYHGAEIITVPSAFSPITGAAHWEVLLQARAIETGAFILAPAQTGQHSVTEGKARSTHGYSLVVDPWGRILANAGKACGIISVDLDMAEVAQSRAKIPAMTRLAQDDGP